MDNITTSDDGTALNNRKASIKETGEEISQEDWARFDAAVAEVQAERERRDDRREDAGDRPRDETTSSGRR